LGGRKIDFYFIDGAHGHNDATYDFYSYMEYLAPGAIVGFHDIFYTEGLVDAGSQVCWLWERLKRVYNYNEFYAGSSMGIGFIYRGQLAPASPHEV
jgi:predicted O-methyltransferase YrrM